MRGRQQPPLTVPPSAASVPTTTTTAANLATAAAAAPHDYPPYAYQQHARGPAPVYGGNGAAYAGSRQASAGSELPVPPLLPQQRELVGSGHAAMSIGGNRFADANDGRVRQISQNGGGAGAIHQLPPGTRLVNGQQQQQQQQQVIGPSHPQHPQHGQWLAHQQQQQQMQMQMQMNHAHVGGGGRAAANGHALVVGAGPPGQYSLLPGPTFPSPSIAYLPYSPLPTGLPNAPLHAHHQSPRNPSALPYSGGPGGPNGSIASPIVASPRTVPPPPQAGGPGMTMHALPHPHGQIAPPARTIPSAASMRPLSALGGGAGGGGAATSSASPAALSHQQPQHQQSVSPFPQYGSHLPRASVSGPSGPPPQARPGMRQNIASQPNTLLAAHVAVNGTGPITATSAPSGPAIARLAAFNEALQLALEQAAPLEALRGVVADHFTDTGVVKIGLIDTTAQMTKVFEIPSSAFPRFMNINHLLGAISTCFYPILVREFRLTTPDPSGPRSPPAHSGSPSAAFPVHIGYLLRSEDAMWASRYGDGTRVDVRGSLTVHLMFKDLGNGAAGLRIESLEFNARGFEEYVPRSTIADIERALVAAAADAATQSSPIKSSTTLDDSVSKDGDEGAPLRRRTSKTQTRGMNTRRRSAATKSEQDVADDEDQSTLDDASTKESKATPTLHDRTSDLVNLVRARVAPSPVGSFGVTEMGMRCLEIAESVAQLQNLIAFSIETRGGPFESLARYADLHRSGAFAPAPPFPPGAGPSHVQNGYHGEYSGPGPMQQTFAAHPGLGGDIGGGFAEPTGLKRPAPTSPMIATVLEQMDRDLPSPQKMPRAVSNAPRGRGRGR